MAQSATFETKRVSRYASQQTTQEARAPNATLQPLDESAVDTQLARSRSRYRRTVLYDDNATQQTGQPVTAPVKEQVDVVQRRQSRRQSQLAPIVQPNLSRKPSAKRYRDSHASPPLSPPAVADILEVPSLGESETEWNDAEARGRRVNERYTVTRDSPQESPATPPLEQTQLPLHEPFPSSKAEPVQPLARPVRLDGPPSLSPIRATQTTSASPTFVHSEDDHEEEGAGCFGLFKRRKIERKPNMAEKTSILRPKKSREQVTIKPGGGGVVPGIDAPLSAVNAGDREVLVECGKSKTIFPVTLMTTPVDIINSAAKCMPERINVKSAVLLEHFGTVGVQRPLRRYEHIRDVMNSWDTDKENSLILVDPGTGSSEVELSVAGVPPEKPGDDSWLLEFSQKVGKWDKRIITLRSDGQITVQKDQNKPQEQTNLCHLSDFDIYRPTQEKVRKKIRPPKKFCFAIKSQQKTSMFESTYDFVHFFCTNDRPTADAFYSAVQGWRSWYLVNVMGEGRKPRQTKESLEKPLKDAKLDDAMGTIQRRGDPSEAQHQSGSFKPLLSVSRVEMPTRPAKSRELQAPTSPGFTKSTNQLDTTISPERRTSAARKQQHPPGSMMNRAQLGEDEPLANLARNVSVNSRGNSLDGRKSNSEEVAPIGRLGVSQSQRRPDRSVGKIDTINQRRPSIDRARSNPEEFAETGLLGRNYSQRRKDQAERENKAADPFTSGQNLLNINTGTIPDDHSPTKAKDGVQRRPSARPQHTLKTSGDEDLQRANSRTIRKEMPEPLIDLTPQYREPPQHAKKGKAFIPEKVGEGGLVDSATSPEDPISIPPLTDWRAGRNPTKQQNPPSSLTRDAAAARSTKRRDRETDPAFTGDGLLAGSQAGKGWGKNQTGRGVIDGSRAKGPMLDLSVDSIFAHGSLIAKVESAEGPAAPIIDRSRKDD